MLTGTRLFQADSLAETLADVLRADIDLTKLPPDVPEPVRELLARCLDRDPKNRLRDLGEARVLLGNVLSDPSNLTTRETLPAAPPRRRAWLAIGTVMAVLAIAAVIVYSNRPKSAPGPRQVQSAATVPDTATSTAQALASAAENAVSAVASVVSPNKPKAGTRTRALEADHEFSEIATSDESRFIPRRPHVGLHPGHRLVYGQQRDLRQTAPGWSGYALHQ